MTIENKTVFSEELGLELVETDLILRLRNPVDGEFLETNLEMYLMKLPAIERAENATQLAKAATERADEAIESVKLESERAKLAELELEKLRDELRQIRNQK